MEQQKLWIRWRRINASHANAPPTVSEKIISVGNVSTTSTKSFKLPDSTTFVPSKSAEIFRGVGDNCSLVLMTTTLISKIAT